VVESLKRPAFLSAKLSRVRIQPVEGQPVTTNGEPFSGVGYARSGEHTYEAVQVLDGTLVGPFDDPVLPPGPYVDLAAQPDSTGEMDTSVDWWYLGRPFSGISIDFAPQGYVDRVTVVKGAIPMEEFSFDHSGVVVRRVVDKWFDPVVVGGLSSIRQWISWSTAGDVKHCLTTLTAADSSASAKLSLLSAVSVSISTGYFDALQLHRSRLDQSLPIIDDLKFLDGLKASDRGLRLGLGDRSIDVVERLVASGHLGTTRDVSVIVDPGAMEGLAALAAIPAPPFESLKATPASGKGGVRMGSVEVLALLLDLKRRHPGLQVSFATWPLLTVSDLSVQRDPGNALYFDDQLKGIVGVVGGISINNAELLDYVVSAPSLAFVKLPSAIPLYEEMRSQLQARADIALIQQHERTSEWLPEVLRRLNGPTT